MDRHKRKGVETPSRPQKNGNVSGTAARSAAARRRAVAARKRRARALRRRRILVFLIMAFCLVLFAVGGGFWRQRDLKNCRSKGQSFRRERYFKQRV